MSDTTGIVPVSKIETAIVVVRDQRVIIDADLARLYGVTTKRFNEQVKRNVDRFPPDFMFQLTGAEAAALRSQFATSKTGRGGRRYLPLAFTEHGAIMAANVLNSPQAVQASVLVVRAFVRLREFLSTRRELSAKLDELEKRLDGHDQTLTAVFGAIRQLMQSDAPRRRKPPIGYQTEAAPPKRGKRR